MKLAASDLGRRVAFKVVAGSLALIAAGFLIAALWTFFDRTLHWGPLWASVAVAGVFLVIAAILWALSSRVKHPVPTTDELKREVEARVSLATDVALDKAHAKARQIIDDAGDKAVALMNDATSRASGFVSDAQAKVQGVVGGVETSINRLTSDVPQRVARTVGLTPAFFDEAQQVADKVRTSRAVPGASLLGAFAIGLTLASRLQAGRQQDDWDEEDWEDDDWSDEDDFDDPAAR